MILWSMVDSVVRFILQLTCNFVRIFVSNLWRFRNLTEAEKWK